MPETDQMFRSLTGNNIKNKFCAKYHLHFFTGKQTLSNQTGSWDTTSRHKLNVVQII